MQPDVTGPGGDRFDRLALSLNVSSKRAGSLVLVYPSSELPRKLERLSFSKTRSKVFN